MRHHKVPKWAKQRREQTRTRSSVKPVPPHIKAMLEKAREQRIKGAIARLKRHRKRAAERAAAGANAHERWLDQRRQLEALLKEALPGAEKLQHFMGDLDPSTPD